MKIVIMYRRVPSPMIWNSAGHSQLASARVFQLYMERKLTNNSELFGAEIRKENTWWHIYKLPRWSQLPPFNICWVLYLEFSENEPRCYWKGPHLRVFPPCVPVGRRRTIQVRFLPWWTQPGLTSLGSCRWAGKRRPEHTPWSNCRIWNMKSDI